MSKDTKKKKPVKEEPKKTKKEDTEELSAEELDKVSGGIIVVNSSEASQQASGTPQVRTDIAGGVGRIMKD